MAYCEDDCRSESDSSKWSTSFLERVVQELEVKAVEDSTLASYMVAWHGFIDFYNQLDNKDIAWEHRLELYVAFLVIKKAQEATIKSYISGIKYVAKLIGINIDDSKCRFHALVKAARIKNRRIKIRLPIKLWLLNRMIEEVPRVKKLSSQPYLIKLFQAIFVSAYYGLLRISKITGSKHSIKSGDVHIAKDRHSEYGQQKTKREDLGLMTLKLKGSWIVEHATRATRQRKALSVSALYTLLSSTKQSDQKLQVRINFSVSVMDNQSHRFRLGT